ncbi:hypothetical protein PO124_27970 [Bacillus licheniformis]|nr:hypothetical protein [Bacillus licheniformis]
MKLVLTGLEIADFDKVPKAWLIKRFESLNNGLLKRKTISLTSRKAAHHDEQIARKWARMSRKQQERAENITAVVLAALLFGWYVFMGFIIISL